MFFATYCKPCLKGIKALARAAPRLKAAGISVVLHNSFETPEQITPWLKKHGVPNEFRVILDEFGTDCERFGCKIGTELRLPLTVIVDELGVTQAIFRQEGADFVDLDGPLWQKIDVEPALSIESGCIQPPEPALWG